MTARAKSRTPGGLGSAIGTMQHTRTHTHTQERSTPLQRPGRYRLREVALDLVGAEGHQSVAHDGVGAAAAVVTPRVAADDGTDHVDPPDEGQVDLGRVHVIDDVR